MIRNFSFVLKDRLAGCSAPGSWTSLEDDLESLKRKGIGALVSLTEVDLDKTTLRKSGLDYLHLPVPDFRPPTPAQIRQFVEFVRSHIEKRKPKPVAVHCFAGRGRTGTMLACYLVSTGISAEEAIRTLRRLRPGSIESPEQERAIANYQAWLQEMGQWKGTRGARRQPTRKSTGQGTRKPKSSGGKGTLKSKRSRKAPREKPPGGSTPLPPTDPADNTT